MLTTLESTFRSLVSADMGDYSDGHVDSPSGFFSHFDFSKESDLIQSMSETFGPDFGSNPDVYPITPGHYLVSINDLGFVDITEDDEDTINTLYTDLECVYAAWHDEVELY